MTIGVQPDIIKDIPFEQITEITGVTDRSTILKTWNNCLAKGDNVEGVTSDVIASLLAPDVSHEPTENNSLITYGPALPSSSIGTSGRPRTSSMDTQSDTVPMSASQVVDLTADDDIQKAIAASLENQSTTRSMLGGQISREEQDISRVLEASLADTKSTDGKKNTMWYFDHANPYERRREDSWPIGLKNVGNTCWFNAVIQSLFHIEAFRDLVINYEPTGVLSKENQIAVFMVELRRLFALMLASDRQYLDPSSAIEILKQSFSTTAGQSTHLSNDQQDVSEFQHKLLDWLEEAFQQKLQPDEEKASSSSSDVKGEESAEPMDVDGMSDIDQKDNSNPMVKLFYGKVKTIGSNAGEAFTTHTHFGQWPLYVAGYADIHESLEMGLAPGDIETNSTEHVSNQEQWFTHLPPLLTFELSRFSYNTMQLQAEKLHNKFSFPQTIYLDRYLEVNKEEIREKRSKLSSLKSELINLESGLHRYTHYGGAAGEDSKNSHYPLPDILGYALQFAMSGLPSSPNSSVHSTGSPASDRTIKSRSTTEGTESSQPRPKDASEEEVRILRSCLARWKQEVEVSIRQLEQRIDELKHNILQAYDHPHLKQHKYCLHAVMVHEGEAISGHYWSYVCNKQNDLWLKFNDVRVSHSSWDEVVKESEGGTGTASAYCLIYTHCSQSNPQSTTQSDGTSTIASPSGQDFPSKEEALRNLPSDLQVYVTEDNQRLRDEMYNWDTKRSTAVTATVAPQGTSSPLPDSVPMDQILSTTSTDTGGLGSPVEDEAHSHAQPVLSLVKRKYAEINKQLGTTVSWNYKLELLVKACFDIYYEMSLDRVKSSRPDTRTHMALYLLIVYKSLDHTDIKTVIADHIARLDNMADLPGWTYMRREAALMVSKLWDGSYEFQANYIKWHQEYHQFRVAFSLFVEGLTLFNAERCEDALPYLHDACIRNAELMRAAEQEVERCNKELKSLDQNLLSTVRNSCLQMFNEMAFAQFESEDDYKTPLKVILIRVLPILDMLQADNDNIDNMNFAGSIKDRWVNLLADEDNVEENRMESLKEFIGQLFEPATNPAPVIENAQALIDLKTKYTSAIQQYNSRG